MGNIYLVDFENVGSDGLSGILNLTTDDRVIIFYSTRSNRLTMRAHILIGRAQAQFTYYEATVGAKNALDHQLSTYLGYLIGSNAAEHYYIVSKDNGYRYASNFWNELLKQTAVFCVDCIKNAPKVTDRMLRRSQSEMTLRTAEDLHDDDLTEEDIESAGAGESELHTEEQEISDNPLQSAEAEEPGAIPHRNQLEEDVPSTEQQVIVSPPAVEEQADIPEESSRLNEQESAADSISVPVQVVQSLSEDQPAPAELPVSAEMPSVNEPQQTLPPVYPALPAPVAENTAVPDILFPGNEIDDVPDPNRASRNSSRRQQVWQDNNKNRHNRKSGSNQRTEESRKTTNDTTSAEHRSAGNGNWSNGNGRKDENRSAHSPSDQDASSASQNDMRHGRQSQKPRQSDHNSVGKQEKSGDNDKKSAHVKSAETRNPENQERDSVLSEKTDTYDWLTPLLAPYPKLSAEKIREMIAGRQKQVLCNSLRKQLGQEKGLALYSEIKKSAWK